MKNSKLTVLLSLVVIVCASLLLTLMFITESNVAKNKEIIYIDNVVSKEEIVESIKLSKDDKVLDITNAVKKASKKYKIPKEVIYAVISTESSIWGTKDLNDSNFMEVNHRAKSSCNCLGLMQVSKYALDDYNRINKTNYSMEDLYNISTNIEIGTWYFSQFRTVATSWTEMYVIYNVGYGMYNKNNKYWFYDLNGSWKNEERNSFFFMNNLYPPTDSNHGMYGKNKLPDYHAKKRFEVCYSLCKKNY